MAASGIKNVFRQKEAPYFLTLLIGLIAYQVNNVANIYTNAPTLAYRFEKPKVEEVSGDQVSELTCSVTNISVGRALKDVELTFAYPSTPTNYYEVKDSLYRPIVIPVHPSSDIPDYLHNELEGKKIQFKIPQIQPGNTYLLLCKVKSFNKSEDTPYVYLSSSDTVLLLKNSPIVFFVKNILELNIGLTIIWVFFLILYFRFLAKENVRDQIS